MAPLKEYILPILFIVIGALGILSLFTPAVTESLSAAAIFGHPKEWVPVKIGVGFPRCDDPSRLYGPALCPPYGRDLTGEDCSGYPTGITVQTGGVGHRYRCERRES